MSENFKKIIKQKLEPMILEKGFVLDEKTSKFAKGFVYVKLYGKDSENDLLAKELKEEIWIYPNRWSPTIQANIRSTFKHGNPSLSYLDGLGYSRWWPVGTEEEAEASIAEIARLLDKYAWDWFAQKDPEKLEKYRHLPIDLE